MENLGDIIWLIGLAALWSSVWKGIALWRAARNNSVPWFVVLLVVNTLGILEILYIFVFGKKEPEQKDNSVPPSPLM